MGRAIWLSVITVAAIIVVGLLADTIRMEESRPRTRLIIAALVITSLVVAFFIWCVLASPLAFRG